MKKVVAIIQARMSSKRLPGKVLMDIEGKPMLQRVIERVKQAKLLNEVIVAFTINDKDDKIANLVYKLGLHSYRGKELDVLDRFRMVAIWRSPDIIVRITSDCPLIDPKIVDKVIQYYLDGDFDYVSNCEDYAFGLDVEIFSYKALERAWNEATEPYDREHVTTYIINHPDIFKVGKVLYNIPKNISNTHWAVDTREDLEFVRKLYKKLGDNFTMEDVLKEVENVKV